MTATARIDPRFRDRRVAVIRTQGRRRLRVLVASLIVIGVVVGTWLLVTSPLLAIDRIDVVGTTAVSEEDVLGAAGVDIGDPVLLVDRGAVERRIEAVPAVGEAHVHRELPDGLRIAVVERDPVAWARGASGTIAVLDATGRVIGGADEPPALPEVTGLARLPVPGSTSEWAAATAEIPGELPAELRARVQTIAVHGGTVVLGLDDGIEVRLGPPRAVAAKGRAARAVLAAVDPGTVSYVDVRVPAGPVTGSM